MAVDEAILENIGRGGAPATLRLYAWSPPCLSLGYSQPFAEVDLDALGRLGWDLVRRPTGGRAILHTDELTYSIAGPHEDPRLVGSVLESYRVLSTALLYALHLLGIQAESLEQPQPAEVPGNPNAAADRFGPVCFEVPSNYEITVNHKKLIGSAQARRKEGVLQHGSLPLIGDLSRILQVLRLSTLERQQAKERLLARAATASSVLGRSLSWEAASQAIEQAFCERLNLEFEPGEMTPWERRRAQELVEQKYAHPQWTERVS
jgi:lipoate-protein ligase A